MISATGMAVLLVMALAIPVCAQTVLGRSKQLLAAKSRSVGIRAQHVPQLYLMITTPQQHQNNP
jgi:hypothetical protein